MGHPENQVVFVLIGGQDADTDLARRALDEAGVRYRFAYAESTGEASPQLISGLMSFVGLEQILQFAGRAQSRFRVVS